MHPVPEPETRLPSNNNPRGQAYAPAAATIRALEMCKITAKMPARGLGASRNVALDEKQDILLVASAVTSALATDRAGTLTMCVH